MVPGRAQWLRVGWWAIAVGIVGAFGAPAQQLEIPGRIAFMSRRDYFGGEVYAVNADGSGVVRLTSDQGRHSEPAWSPDRTRIALCSYRDGQITVMDADGANMTPLGASGESPAWSPDGTKIIYKSSPGGHLHTINVDGSGDRQLTDGPMYAEWPAWSPDGEKIAFVANGCIYVMASDGTNQTQLTEGPTSSHSPAWSPDGSRIAYASNRDGNHEIYVMSAQGTNGIRLTNNAVVDGNPSWSIDGTMIAFQAGPVNNLPPELYVMNADGTNRRAITSNAAFDGYPSWGYLQRIGSAPIGAPVARTVTIQNTGSATLEVRSISVSDAQFDANPTIFDVAPGEKQDVLVRFSPVSAGVSYATLTITSNDPRNPVVNLIVNGTGQAIAVSTTSDVDDFGGSRQEADLPGPDGKVSLREAIAAANNTPGPQTIGFAIPTDDAGYDQVVFTIRPVTDPLSAITDGGTVIDGATQTAFSGDTNPAGPEVVIDGALVTNGVGNGLQISEAADCAVRSLVVQNFRLRTGPQDCCTAGVSVDGSRSLRARIADCFIGSDYTGTRAQGNAIGIHVNAPGVVIERNLLSGNVHSGVIAWSSADGTIQGNLVGTDASGMRPLGNANFGVAVGGSGNTIGGTTPEARNVISGGNLGIVLQGQNNLIQGNFIGVAADGQTPLGNTAFGVIVETGNTRATIGGRGEGEANTIAYNGQGILIQPHYVSELPNVTVTVSGNSIYANGLLGIELTEDGPTPNDPGDLDTGVNGLMNYPVLSDITWDAAHTLVRGNIDTPHPETVTVELFANPPEIGPDPSGYGEGARFLGAVTPDASGFFAADLPALAQGSSISATATDAQGNTSEFSRDIVVEPPVTVVSPNGGEERLGGAPCEIRWTTTGSIASVRIEYSVDGGSSWQSIVAATPNDGRYDWVPPRTAAPRVVVRVSDTAVPARTDISDAPFAVLAPPAPLLPGTRIAFTSDRDGNQEIYLMDTDGTNWVNLTNNPADDQEGAWSPDGKRLVFYSNRDGGDWDIFTMNADGSNVVQLTRNDANDWWAYWSPDGRKIVFHSDRDVPDGDIFVMNADGSDPVNLTNGPQEDGGYPFWSPDGSRILFTSGQDGNDEVYAMNADGSNRVRLTNNPAFDGVAHWSPDGSRIDFLSDRDNPGAGWEGASLYTMRPDGTDVVRLTTSPTYVANWSPDGTMIPFHDSATNSEIYVMKADGTGRVRLTYNSSMDWIAVWSPLPPGIPTSDIEALIKAVEELAASGALRRGEANGLTAKLRAAIQQVEKGNPVPAANQLGAFVNQVGGLIKARQLASAKGRPLIDRANAIIARLRGGAAKVPALPTAASLAPAYPNPFNPSTTISYGLPAGGLVRLTVHSSLGQRVATLIDGWQEAGRYSLVWDAAAMAPGVYFCQLRCGEYQETRRMVLVK